MRTLARALLVLLLVAVAGFLLLGYWTTWPLQPAESPSATVGTSGVDTEKARERGAELAEKAAEATAKVQETVAEAALTAKIKAKMTLDDSVKSRAINVTTSGSTVTLNGTVGSAAEHARAVDLARETDGVTEVVDHLTERR